MAFKRVAASLEILLGQINERWPHRSKVSDGALGDSAHAARASDHNPNVAGVVQARDFTNDPKNGPGNAGLLAMLLASKDRRIKYIIADGKIYAGSDGPQPWVGRPYGGANAHEHHLHLSVKNSPALYDDTTPWKLDFKADENVGSALWLQRALNKHGAHLAEDGEEGEKTIAATRAFAVQQLKGM